MPLSAVECPGDVCHSHHGGHQIERSELQENLRAHGQDWCERLAERIYEISIDTFSQTVVPMLQQQGWQKRHLDWEFKLGKEMMEVERTVADGTINAVESFLRSNEIQRLFVKELVGGTFAEADQNKMRSKAVRQVIEEELLAFLQERHDELINRVGEALLPEAGGDLEQARIQAREGLEDVHHLLVNHSEANR
jgi:hypothetical protein